MPQGISLPIQWNNMVQWDRKYFVIWDAHVREFILRFVQKGPREFEDEKTFKSQCLPPFQHGLIAKMISND
jgi:hypothetical protein